MEVADHVEDAKGIQGIRMFPWPIAIWSLAASEEASKYADILDIRSNDDESNSASEID